MSRPISILLVDDDLAFTETLKDVLNAIGYRVDTAADGPQALSMIRDRHFNLILLDLKLPGMNGYDVFREIRRMGKQNRVIMITAYSLTELVEECRDKGSLVFLPKPPKPSTLKRILRSMQGRPALLLAEDDPSAFRGLMESLAADGFRAGWAGDIDTAVDRAALGDHDITFVNVGLGLSTDENAVVLIKELDSTVTIMLALAASRGLTSGAVQPAAAGSAGVLACFQKPLHLRQLIAVLQGVEPDVDEG